MAGTTDEMVRRRRDRAIARMMRYKEADLDRLLPPAVRGQLRKVILDEINDFADFVLDLVRSYEEAGTGVVLNELFFEALERSGTIPELDRLAGEVRQLRQEIRPVNDCSTPLREAAPGA